MAAPKTLPTFHNIETLFKEDVAYAGLRWQGKSWHSMGYCLDIVVLIKEFAPPTRLLLSFARFPFLSMCVAKGLQDPTNR
ncbi:hypothetical protein BKA70DRAFT_1433230 [Coprinopsis sp. MPI-PUGE-AT-0042]|nr:hypothetical protein BKA70DRAFT_1433230 [Coprinopsis sp. MPI-PUGE-AT-0042]